MSCFYGSADAGLEHIAAAFGARRGDIGQNWARKIFNVTTSLAAPSKRPFFFVAVQQLQRLLCVITYFFDNLPEGF
jgi:hypothetical protein